MDNIYFDIDKFVNYLKPFKERLHELYNWNANLEQLVVLNVISENELKEWNSLTNYQKELRIKERVNFNLLNTEKERNTCNKFYDISFWVIKNWGGINLKNEKVKDLVDLFLLNKSAGFDKIASISKIAAFLYPEDFIIYDSRVAYTLNWIILSQNAGNKYFPLPEGRNSKMTAFDMNTLIHIKNANLFNVTSLDELSGKNKFISKKDQLIYINKNEAYSILNKLIKEINEKLWDNEVQKQSKLYYTEMILFSIADKDVFKEISKHFTEKSVDFQNE